MRIEVCFRYFTQPDLLSRWLCNYATQSEYHDDTLFLAWGQDHYVLWRFKELQEDRIVIEQQFMGEAEMTTEILVELRDLGDQTEVKIIQTGVTSEMETDYRSDWYNLRYLGVPKPPMHS